MRNFMSDFIDPNPENLRTTLMHLYIDIRSEAEQEISSDLKRRRLIELSDDDFARICGKAAIDQTRTGQDLSD